jgi:hypothetical protein
VFTKLGDLILTLRSKEVSPEMGGGVLPELQARGAE